MDASLHALIQAVIAVLDSVAWLRFCASRQSYAERANYLLAHLRGEYGASGCYLLHTSSGLDRTFAVEGHPLVHVGESSPRLLAGFDLFVAWRVLLLGHCNGAVTVIAQSDQPEEWRRAMRNPDEPDTQCFQWAFQPVELYDPAHGSREQHENSLLRIDQIPRSMDYPEEEHAEKWRHVDIDALRTFMSFLPSPLYVETPGYDVQLLRAASEENCAQVGEIQRALQRSCSDVREILRQMGKEEPIEEAPDLAPVQYSLADFLTALRPTRPGDPGHMRRIDWPALQEVADHADVCAMTAAEARSIANMLAGKLSIHERLEALELLCPA